MDIDVENKTHVFHRGMLDSCAIVDSFWLASETCFGQVDLLAVLKPQRIYLIRLVMTRRSCFWIR